MAQIAKIAIENAVYAIDKPYDYLIPEDMTVCAGMRVTVPFGRGNRRSEGMVLSVQEGTMDRPLKAVETVLDREPQLSAEQIRLALWMCQRYFCTFYDALHAILPIGLWYQHKELWHLKREPEGELPEKEQVLVSLLREKDRELSQLLEAQPKAKTMLQKLEQQGIVSCARASNRRVSDKTDWRVAFAITSQEAEELTRDKMRRAPRQGAALSFLLKNGETSLHDLIYYTGVQRKWVMKMGEEGVFSLCEQEIFRVPLRPAQEKAPQIQLNDEQQAAYNDILAQIHSGKPGVTLLQGVTGNGGVHHSGAKVAARGQNGYDPGAGNCPDTPNDAAFFPVFR